MQSIMLTANVFRLRFRSLSDLPEEAHVSI